MTSRRNAVLVAVCLAGIVVNLVAFGPVFFRTVTGTNDFRHLYVGASLAGSGGLYEPALVQARQWELLGEINPHLPPTRLPYYYLLLKPLAWMPFAVAHSCWMLLMLGAAALFVYWQPAGRRELAALAACWCFPLSVSLHMGQDLALLLAVWAGAQRLMAAGRPVEAGVLLSLCSIKYHLFALVPVWLAARKEHRVLAGGLAGCAAWMAVSFAMEGAQWPVRYLKVVLHGDSTPSRELMPNLNGVLTLLHWPAWWEEAAGVVLAGVAVYAARQRPAAESAACALLASLLLSHHSYAQDLALVLAALLPLLPTWKALGDARLTQLLLLLPLPYLALYMPALGGIPIALLMLGEIALLSGLARPMRS